MPFKATEDDLIKFLKLSSDTVVEIPVFRRNPRRKIGIAFVNVDIGGVEDVLKFNDEEMMGRKLKISLAKNQSKLERWQPKKVSSRSGVSDGICTCVGVCVFMLCVCVGVCVCSWCVCSWCVCVCVCVCACMHRSLNSRVRDYMGVCV